MGCRSCFLDRKTQLGLGVTAIIVLLTGILLAAFKSPLYSALVLPNLILLPGTALYPSWLDLPLPLETSVYFFNVTNSDEVRSRGAKPMLQEVGPYVFQEWHHKTRVEFNHDNGTSTYQQKRVWFFDEEATPKHLSLKDRIIALNAPAASANGILKTQSPFIRGAANIALKLIKEKLFVNRNVNELLFQGYKDPILTDASWLPDSVVPVKMDKFGYYYPRNNSDWFDGVFNMYTGENGYDTMGKIANWNYSDTMPFYPGKCGKVYGAGDFPSPGQYDDTLEIFSNDMCRTLSLDFDSDISYNGNIPARRYTLTPRFFANATQNPANACFNPRNEIPSGLFNASTCRFGAPIFMSQPHFHQADPVYLRALDGISPPDADAHGTEMIVEPRTGSPVSVLARFQVNFYLEPMKEVDLFSKFKEPIFFPTVWFESKAIVTGMNLEKIYLAANLEDFFLIGGLAMIALTTSYFILLAVVNLKRRRGANAPAPLSSSVGESSSEPHGSPSNDSLIPREEVQPTEDEN